MSSKAISPMTVMHQCNENQSGTVDALAGAYEIVGDELAQVRQLLAAQMQIDHPQLQVLSSHVSQYQGKLLRPALLILSGKMIGQVTARHVNLSAVAELLHQATLVHDDVLDDAKVRRKLPTVSRLWGNEASVLLGDYLLSRAFDLCNVTGDLAAARLISQTAGEICRGELLQCLKRREWDMSEATYLDIIARKTACLYGLCCHLGGHLSGADDEQLDTLCAYGQGIGLAFQIADDVLDLWGREDLAGKTLGSDLTQAKPTLPIIHCLRHGPDSTKARLLERLSACADNETGPDDRAFHEILALLDQADSLDYTRNKARQLATEAKRRLDALPDCPARDAMGLIADFVVERSC